MVDNSKKQISSDSIFSINFWLIVLSITLLRLPIALGYRDDFSYLFLGIIPFLAGIVFNLINQYKSENKTTYYKKGVVLFTIFTFLWIVAMIRTIFIEFTFTSVFILGHLVSWILLLIFTIIAFHNTADNRRNKLKMAIVYSLGLYVIVNLIFYLIGIKPQEIMYLARYPSQMLSLLGISSYRVLFPTAVSINGFGTIAGLGLSGLIFLFWIVTKKIEKILILLMLISCVVVMLLADSRGALIFSLFTIALVCLPPKFFNIVGWTPFIISLFIPILFLINPGSLGERLTFLDRPPSVWNNNDSTVNGNQCESTINDSNGFLTNRTIIWHFTIDKLSQFKLIHIPGYGFRGQSISNLSEKYACLFYSYENREFTTTHQVWLQTIIDTGYLGFSITLLGLIWLVYILGKQRIRSLKKVETSLLAMIIYIITAGALEATLYPDAFEIFCVFFLVLICIIYPSPSETGVKP